MSHAVDGVGIQFVAGTLPASGRSRSPPTRRRLCEAAEDSCCDPSCETGWIDPPLQVAGRGPRAVDGRVRDRLHEHADGRAWAPADRRGALADHDRLHARADAGAVGNRAGFATLDHWFGDVPTCTYPNRSFFHAGQSSGYVVKMSPPGCFQDRRRRDTVRSPRRGRTHVEGLPRPPSRYAPTGVIRAPRLAGKFATNFFSTRQF
jgi:hypothetical protein